LALYALLSLFPALTAAVAVYGLFASPAQIGEQLRFFQDLLPAEAMSIVQREIQQLTSQGQQSLGFGAILGLLLALWSARSGMVALISALNVAYKESETRGFFKRMFLSLTFTISAVVGFVFVLLLGIAVPIALNFLPLGQAAEWVVHALRAGLLWLMAIVGLAFAYRFAPNRHGAQWRWLSWGSAIAATLWLLGSAVFGIYVQRFGSYGETYGALAGVVIMLLWFYVSAYLVVLGAEINAEMERQTAEDTTAGTPKPMGERGAYAADTLGAQAGRH
jgi:membrane protein